MYWSGCQSTGAEMRKYFTREHVSRARTDNPVSIQTYGCQLVAELPEHREGGPVAPRCSA